MINSSAIQYAGEYEIKELKVVTTRGNVFDVQDLFQSINFYEDIFQNAITGEIILADTTNIVSNFPIIGEERLIVRLRTPTENNSKLNEINFVDVPLYIYSLSSQVRKNENTRIVVLSFTSSESLRNNQVRLSKAFRGKPSDIVKNIFKDEYALNSKRKLFVEDTANLYKFVIPNMRPFDAINMLSTRSNSGQYNNAPTFLFYETTKGFHYRSIDGLCSRQNVKMTYKETLPDSLSESTKQKDVLSNLTNIKQYSFVNSKNTVKNTRAGYYGSSLEIHDIYNKKIDKYSYNYLDEFPFENHTNRKGDYVTLPSISESQDQFGNRLSDYENTRIHYHSNTSNHLFYENNSYPYQSNNVENWLLRRNSRFLQIENSTKLRMMVAGITHLQVGDLIEVLLPAKSTLTSDTYDRYNSGRYLITKLRHQFEISPNKEHTIHMEVIRDDVSSNLPSEGANVESSATATFIEVDTDEDIIY